MAIATVGKPERFELKTIPSVGDEAGGYVVIRRLNHGEKMHRRSYNSKMVMQQTRGSKEVRSEIDLFKEAATIYDFQNCIVEHNLEYAEFDDEGNITLRRPLNFKNEVDIKLLDGKVSEEIDTYIGRMNNFEDDDDTGKSSES